jgi:hypothetical protein
MAVTNFSPLLGFALPTTGDLSGTWGATVNDAITSLIDSAVAGTTTLSANSDVTLTTTNGASNQARNAIILWTASNGATTRFVTAPAQSKAYIVINAGTGTVVIRGSGPTTGVSIASGFKAIVAWNGSDFVKVASSLVNLTSDVAGVLPTANGGTNLSSFTSGGAVYATSTSALATGTLPVASGGTGQTSYTDGQLLIGNSSGNTLTKATLTAGSNVTITNGNGTITIAATSGGSGTITAVTASTPLSATPGTTPNITLSGIVPIANGGTGNSTGVAVSAPLLQTTNFSIAEVGGVLVFKYGATTIATMDSSGNLTTLANVTAYGSI